MKVEKKNLNELIASGGWKLIKDKLIDELNEVENLLLSDVDSEKNKCVFTEYDILRTQRSLIKRFLDMPEDLEKIY